METCTICGDALDSRSFRGYDICTACADLMEDLMSEYFIRTVGSKKDTARRGFARYLDSTTNFVSDYMKIRTHARSHARQISEKLAVELESATEGSRKRYVERLMRVLGWLENNPAFYNDYFKGYYVCPGCKASIFDHYTVKEDGDWLEITCGKCGTGIKRYFSPKHLYVHRQKAGEIPAGV